MLKHIALLAPWVLLTAAACASAAPAPDAAAVLADLQRKVPHFRVVRLPARAGETRLAPEQSLTVDDLRGVDLDATPPVLGRPAKPYPAEHTDGLPAGQGPYVAPGIRPFRLREFTAEFSYGGWHNFNLYDYAATHGFGVLFPYVMEDTAHLPTDTGKLRWGSFVDWPKFLQGHGIAEGRYDRLVDLDVPKELLDSGTVWAYTPGWIAMLDLEHGSPLSPDDLRKQEWYPKTAGDAERTEFERRYYAGYLSTYTGPVEALRRKGWTSVGVYPQPYGSGWFALLALAERKQPGLPDSATYWPWLRYGKALTQAQDVLYPDIYLYYWSPQNVAYTLARMDFDRALLRSMPQRKPYRPYFWPLLHGGDADPHWWAQQPIPTEDERAIFCLAFFAGCDGLVLWNWSEFANHHVAPELWRKAQTTPVGDRPVDGGIGTDVMLRDGFALRPQGAAEGTPPTEFRRYDVLAITAVDEAAGLVRFQHISTRQQRDGLRLDPRKPTYAMKREDLLPHLRPTSEPVAGAVEGLALVKALEPILRRGEVKVDVPALDQFSQTLPIVRRVKLGRTHLLATYDPLAIHGGAPRSITLKDFDGRDARTLILPADRQVRVWALVE